MIPRLRMAGPPTLGPPVNEQEGSYLTGSDVAAVTLETLGSGRQAAVAVATLAAAE